jgi:DMSO/TMAO reductase YedYZ molybdopterin-dependent catalytic subunit
LHTGLVQHVTMEPMTASSPTDWYIPKWRAGLAGALAAAASLSTGEFVGALAAPRPGPVTAVANRVVDNAPVWFVNFGKDVFGLSDKPALIIGTVLISIIIAVGLGIASRRHTRIGVLGITVFGLLGWLAIATDAQGGVVSGLLIAIFATAAGIATLTVMLFLGSERTRERGEEGGATEGPGPAQSMREPIASRRSFLGWAGIAAAVTTAGAAAGRSLRGRSAATEARASVEIAPVGTAEDVAAQVALAEANPINQISGIAPIVVPNDDFYRIDTALLVPQVDPSNWTLRIHGMVDNELTFTYQELLDRANTIAPVTLSCVSNAVGGDLVGNAVWQGIPLTELLDEAGVQLGATQIRSTSVDGWDCGFPTDLAYDGRTALLVVAMNGEPLPIDHGFPARLVVSGLYGYVSATKWISEIELTTLEDFDGYWIPRGWSKSGPIKTQSRIDTPRAGAGIPIGTEIAMGGVAWAPNLGIEKVEVRVDEGPWTEAELGDSLGINSWRQWFITWVATEGNHRVQVRATDGSGQIQTDLPAAPAPNGASGWHSIPVNGV